MTLNQLDYILNILSKIWVITLSAKESIDAKTKASVILFACMLMSKVSD